MAFLRRFGILYRARNVFCFKILNCCCTTCCRPCRCHHPRRDAIVVVVLRISWNNYIKQILRFRTWNGHLGRLVCGTSVCFPFSVCRKNIQSYFTDVALNVALMSHWNISWRKFRYDVMERDNAHVKMWVRSHVSPRGRGYYDQKSGRRPILPPGKKFKRNVGGSNIYGLENANQKWQFWSVYILKSNVRKITYMLFNVII